MMSGEVLRGRVQSGKGDASKWLALFNAAYARKLGMPVFPGSLNLALGQAFDWHAAALQPRIIRFDRQEYGGERDILLLRCVLRNLKDQSGFLWTTTTAAKDREDPWVVEVIAPVGLRATYGLSDGDEVVVELIE
jgi:CTP-dependent riboflavin kinase